MVTILQKNQDFYFKPIKGESILLNPKTGDYFGMNEVGTDFYQLLDQGMGLEQIMPKLLEIYDVEEPVLRKDIGEFVDSLRQKGLLM